MPVPGAFERRTPAFQQSSSAATPGITTSLLAVSTPAVSPGVAIAAPPSWLGRATGTLGDLLLTIVVVFLVALTPMLAIGGVVWAVTAIARAWS